MRGLLERLGFDPAGFGAPLRHRDFRLFVGGQAFSTFGDLMFAVALPYLVLRMGDAADLGVMMTSIGVARFAASAGGGVLADRMHPRFVMAMGDGGRIFGLVLLILASAQGSAPVWQLAVVGLLMGACDGLYLPAYRAIFPRLLRRDELQAGNALSEGTNVVAVILGPLVANLHLNWLSPSLVLGADAVTFLISAATLLLMSGVDPERRGAALPAALAEHSAEAKHRSREGDGTQGVPGDPDADGAADEPGMSLREFTRVSPLFVVILALGAAASATGEGIVAVALPVFGEARFPETPVFGYLLAAHGAGMLLGSVVAGAFSGMRHRGLVAVGLVAAHGLLLFGFPSLSALRWMLAAMVALGIVDVILTVLVMTLLQEISPSGLLGRVMGAFTLVRSAMYPVSMAVAGYVVSQWDAEAMLRLSGTVVLLAALLAMSARSVREA